MRFKKTVLAWLEQVLNERFGNSFILQQQNDTLIMYLPFAAGGIVFDTLQPEFHKSSSDMPCCWWDAISEGWLPSLGSPLPVPALVDSLVPLVERIKGNFIVHYDILGLTYWMMSRLEEVGRTDLDAHGRFPAISSHAYKYGYLERPIVDEWLGILGQVIQRQWPTIKLKQHSFTMKLSHDVDSPSQYGFHSQVGLARVVGGNIFKRHLFSSFVTGPIAWIKNRNEFSKLDPYNTFDWIMDISEKNNLISAFYFICGRTDTDKDAKYELEHPAVRSLMRRIHARGHEIGLHPSYNTYQHPDRISQEANRLKAVCVEENIEQSKWGGRMHYLRWEHPTTLYGWEQADMSYDSTLGYADRPGFRCGTCFEYPAFEPKKQEILKLRIRPLVVMECTVMDSRYMGLGVSDGALKKFMRLKQVCRAVDGNFTLLWHNTSLTTKQKRLLYEEIVSS
ncbi:polysaccharide deacetylase family protein [Desulfuromonas acetoxidans]|uniref:polysaccharide deacetylase family protein n=1 Tax=Desulfuromonas acetoxidans TaxID=891 RepID=UPI00293080C1|nr:polysaccharide deacetylase family protein [Desulfuromonas acetoxidans]